MLSARVWLVPTAAVCLSAAAGWADDVKAPETPGEVEVQFANGSLVRMVFCQDKIEVQTRYGKLHIPARDIQRIDFGVHLAPETLSKVNAALRKLGSGDYSDRDAGERELIALGPSAYPAVLQAVKNIDQEVARRAEKVLTAHRAKFNEKDLRTREEDIIATPGFTILGRISDLVLKGQSEYFGDVQLHISQLRQLRSLRTPGELQVNVDAAQFGSSHGTWMDTGYLVERSTTLTVDVSGTIDIYPQTPGQYLSTPRGYGNAAMTAGTKVPLNQTSLRNLSGALIGRIGENGEAFYVGEHYEGNPGQEGRLFVHIVPSPWNNASSGSYKVRVSARN
jgi:hypothetical protein